MTAQSKRKDIFPLLEEIAEELRLAREHVLVARQHAEKGEVPRFGAHMLSAEGHLAAASQIRQTVAKIHATHSTPTA
jgi:hypothetical protein